MTAEGAEGPVVRIYVPGFEPFDARLTSDGEGHMVTAEPIELMSRPAAEGAADRDPSKGRGHSRVKGQWADGAQVIPVAGPREGKPLDEIDPLAVFREDLRANPNFSRIRATISQEIALRCGQVPDVHPRLHEAVNVASIELAKAARAPQISLDRERIAENRGVTAVLKALGGEMLPDSDEIRIPTGRFRGREFQRRLDEELGR